MTEKEYYEYWRKRTPEERIGEIERLRKEFVRAYPFLPDRLIKVVRKRKLHERDYEKELVDGLYQIFYKKNKDRLLDIPHNKE